MPEMVHDMFNEVFYSLQVASDVVQTSKKPSSDSKNRSDASNTVANISSAKLRRNLFQKSKSMVVDDHPEEIKWMKLRSIELTTADGLPPLPMHLSWVRGGIMVVGMDNEMHVYSQWRGSTANDICHEEDNDQRSFDEVGLSSKSVANFGNRKGTASAFKPSYSMPSFKHLQKKDKKGSDMNLMKMGNLSKTKSESSTSLSIVHELGLFEASRQANPVLPQYHPKKLMELLNFGKVRRVKAILAHLVRFIAGGDVSDKLLMGDQNVDDLKWSLNRPRTLSVAGASPGDAPVLHEEVQLDYKELSFIPPLPMYALLAADDDYSVAKTDTITTTSHGQSTTGKQHQDTVKWVIFAGFSFSI